MKKELIQTVLKEDIEPFEVSKNKRYGQFFTPKEIVDFMINLITKDHKCAILEPCAGKGVFLESLSKIGYDAIRAYEIDKSLQNSSNVKICYSDFLETTLDEKYDVIIGNPPYVRWKNIPENLKETLKTNLLWSNNRIGLNDLLYFFIIHSINKLKPNGELIFITPLFWTSTLHSKVVRRAIVENGMIELMINFNEAKVFDKVSSNILIFKFVKKKSNQPMKVINLQTKKAVTTKTICDLKNSLDKLDYQKEINIGDINGYLHEQFFSEDPWKPLPPNSEFEILKTENNSNSKLGNIAEIGNGMVSGLDEAFKVEDKSLFSENERKKLISVVKAKNLTKYFNSGYTDYIYVNDIENEEQLKSFPKIFDKLFYYKRQLEGRYAYNKNIPWWHWVFLRNKKLIETTLKVIVPCKERFDNRNYVRFALVVGNFYATQDVTALVKKPEVKEDIKYILALLNSKVIFEWLKYRGLRRGGVLEFSEKPLSEIPIKRIDWSNEEEVHTYEKIINLVDIVIQKKDCLLYEDQIEKLVRKIYGL